MQSNIDKIAEYHGNEQRAYVLKKLGDLSRLSLNGNRVLCVTYITPIRSKGGIWAPTQTDESVYQGKVGYIIKKGPLAFKDDERTKFMGFNPGIGDWVFYRPSLAVMQLRYDGVDCRVFSDDQIGGTLQEPEKMW